MTFPLFFADEPLTRRKDVLLKAPPPVPETSWRPPAEFPNLSAASIIGIDVETKETDFGHGPGWSRGKGAICGFSIAAKDRAGNRGKWYFPVRHELGTEHNLNPAHCFGWAKSVLETNTPKVGANLIYDLGWLTTENIYATGPLHDVQFAEAILHDNGRVALDYISRKYLGVGKGSAALYQWLATCYGGAVSDGQRSNIYRAPPLLVGPYAEDDADLPIDILEKQIPLLWNEETYPLYRMECELIPLFIRMRLAGIRIDVPYAEQLFEEIGNDTLKLYEQLFQDTGVRGKVSVATDVARMCDSVGIQYPLTAAGNPSFQKEYLKSVHHPVADLINDIREHEKIRSTFVKSCLLDSHINGIIHCSYHPLRGDDGGTITGRLSSSDPNLQNVPVRTELGKKIRKAFLPDYGHKCIEKNDHSQIEYRMLANYAVGPGSTELRQSYIDDPDTDYHNIVQANVKRLAGILIDRRPIKNINFGLIYGQTQKSLAYKAGFTPKQSSEIFEAYHKGAPYVKPTMADIAAEVQREGYVTTILGRRVRFDQWEPLRRDKNDLRRYAMEYNAAIATFGPMIKRAGDYKGVNYKLQGSAADVLKKGMHKAYYDGVFDVIGVPRLQVHDELDFSVIDDSERQNEGYAYMRHCLETAVSCRVPIRVDYGRGANWGSVE